MDLLSFIQSVLPSAQQASQQTGLPVDYIIAQSDLETGAGSSNLAVNSNNYFGITNPGGGFASYASLPASFSAYANLIQTPRYAGVASYSEPGAIGNAMQSAGYSTDPAYGSKIAALVPSIDSILQTLGITNPGQSTAATASGGATNPAGTTGSTSQSSGGILASIGNYILNGGVLLLGIIIVGIGLWMAAK